MRQANFFIYLGPIRNPTVFCGRQRTIAADLSNSQ